MGYDFRLAKNNEIDTIYSLYEKRIQWMDQSVQMISLPKMAFSIS